jgi:hypothetical protein
MQKKLSALTFSLLTLPMLAVAENTSPWLPIPGEFSLGVNHTIQSADSVYIGDQEVKSKMLPPANGANEYEVTVTSLQLKYGILDSLSVDLTGGIAEVEIGSATEDGNRDTVLGINWRVVDEFTAGGAPTVTLRAAAIIKGSYESESIVSLGKGANGVEVAAIVGKQFGIVSLWGELGLQDRSNSVPKAIFYGVNVGFQFIPQLNLTLGYDNKEFDGDLDIGGPGFTGADKFQQVAEERTVFKAGLNYSFVENQAIAVNFAQLTDGRNTINDDAFSLSYAVSF